MMFMIRRSKAKYFNSLKPILDSLKNTKHKSYLQIETFSQFELI